MDTIDNTERFLVSICCIVYNQEKFVKKTIESFLMQKTNFLFEILIHDDASKDSSPKILADYHSKYPKQIKIIYQEKNKFSQGINPAIEYLFPKCTGKYIAVCEGDDYWIDPLKLQKQVDFLEANPDFILCFHNAFVLWENKMEAPELFCPVNQKEVSGVEDVIDGWFIPSASMVFRKSAVEKFPDWFKSIYNGDWGLQLLISTMGKIGYIDEVMSIYRKADSSLSGGIGKNVEFVNKKREELLFLFNKHTDRRYETNIQNKIKSLQKETRNYRLKKNYPILYYIINPMKTLKKILKKLIC